MWQKKLGNDLAQIQRCTRKSFDLVAASDSVDTQGMQLPKVAHQPVVALLRNGITAVEARLTASLGSRGCGMRASVEVEAAPFDCRLTSGERLHPRPSPTEVYFSGFATGSCNFKRFAC